MYEGRFMSNTNQIETVDLWAFVVGAVGFVADVAHGGTRLLLTLDGREMVAVVPMCDYQRLQQSDEQKGVGQ